MQSPASFLHRFKAELDMKEASLLSTPSAAREDAPPDSYFRDVDAEIAASLGQDAPSLRTVSEEHSAAPTLTLTMPSASAASEYGMDAGEPRYRRSTPTSASLAAARPMGMMPSVGSLLIEASKRSTAAATAAATPQQPIPQAADVGTVGAMRDSELYALIPSAETLRAATSEEHDAAFLREQVQSLVATLQLTAADHKRVVAENDSMSAQIRELVRYNTELLTRVAHADARVSSLEESLAGAQADAEHWKRAASDANARVDAAKVEVEQLEAASKAQLESGIMSPVEALRLQQENLRLEKEVLTLRTHLNDMRQLRRGVTAAGTPGSESSSSPMSAAEDAAVRAVLHGGLPGGGGGGTPLLAAHSQELESLRKAKDDAESVARVASASFARQREELARLRAETSTLIRELKSRAEAAIEEAASAGADADAANKQAAALQAQVLLLQTEVRTLQARLTAADALRSADARTPPSPVGASPSLAQLAESPMRSATGASSSGSGSGSSSSSALPTGRPAITTPPASAGGRSDTIAVAAYAANLEREVQSLTRSRAARALCQALSERLVRPRLRAAFSLWQQATFDPVTIHNNAETHALLQAVRIASPATSTALFAQSLSMEVQRASDEHARLRRMVAELSDQAAAARQATEEAHARLQAQASLVASATDAQHWLRQLLPALYSGQTLFGDDDATVPLDVAAQAAVRYTQHLIARVKQLGGACTTAAQRQGTQPPRSESVYDDEAPESDSLHDALDVVEAALLPLLASPKSPVPSTDSATGTPAARAQLAEEEASMRGLDRASPRTPEPMSAHLGGGPPPRVDVDKQRAQQLAGALQLVQSASREAADKAAAELSTVQTRVACLEAELDAAKAQTRASADALSREQDARQRAEAQAADAESRVAGALTALAAAEHARDAAQKQLSDVQEVGTKLQALALQEGMAAAQARAAAAEAVAAEVKRQLQQCQDAGAAAFANAQELVQSLQSAEKRLAASEAVAAERLAAVQSCKQELDEARQALNDVRARLAVCEGELLRARADADRALQQGDRKLQEAMAAHASRAATLTSENSGLQARVQELTKMVSTFEQAEAVQAAALAAAQSALRSAEDRHSKELAAAAEQHAEELAAAEEDARLAYQALEDKTQAQLRKAGLLA